MAMKLESVEINNFGPYRDEQVVTFSSSPAHPLVLIHGDNMRGKTSFLNAIRWALYGEAKDRFGKPMPLTRIVNADAANAGDWTMSVTLRFEVDSTQYELTRAIQPKDATVPPHVNDDFTTTLFLKKGGHFLNQEQTQTEINRILPQQIAQFFLFDGEMLYEFESLVANVDKQADAIRESIESILGVPALMHAVADMKQNLRVAEKHQQSLARKDKAAEVYGTKATTLQAEIDVLEQDVEEFQNQYSEQKQKQRELDEQLRESARIEADIETLQALEAQLADLHANEVRLMEQERTKLADAWKDLLQPRLQSRIQELEREQEVQSQRLEQAQQLRTEIAQLESMAATGECPVCHQRHTLEQAAEWRERKATLAKQLQEMDFDEERYLAINQSLRRLRRVPPAGAVSAIQVIEEELKRTRVNIYDTGEKVAAVNDRLKNHDQVAISRNRREYDQVTGELRVLEDRISAKRKEIDKKQKEKDEATRLITQRGGPALERANREVQIYNGLKTIFQQAINRRRDALRMAVERDASEIFKQLTTDKSYQGLRINENYGLTIIDAQGREVPVRSAGAEQVVALSLIGALNRNAVRRGPFVMDSPLGRLDPKHRKNFLTFVPEIADQVTLLVHGGEFDRSVDREEFIKLVDREYDIAYVSSSQSKLVPASEPAIVKER